ncbi:hypothetical protein OHS33_19660 [Streptomyces sp. NBC_00536]|uniref:hypothetical protein n=1 Tax=Streptomyces sp. NBC_00536 TaxID=2975769 RepID=UPI002E807552|nr:hypothetical protein [Streptomyces sp. NBC_00536]WUC80342.1 hypothetical protein OHS33_19660 [Streptomyces sp. NBC_00536]
MTEPQTPGSALSEIILDTPEDAAPQGAREPREPHELLATAKPPRTVNRKAVAAVGAVVALAAVGGFGVWAKGWIADAPRTARTVYWQTADPAPAEAPPTPPVVSLGDLGDRLIPVPDHYKPGPDQGEHSNYFTVPGAKAAQLMKENNRNLPADRRAESDKMVDQLKLKGQAGRSFRGENGDQVVEISITQADPQAVKTFGEFSKKLMEIIGDDRQAPKVEGYPEAKCALHAIGEGDKNNDGEKKEPLESVLCAASQGDFLITFHAYGAKPFKADDEVKLFRTQLDRLKSPGESA